MQLSLTHDLESVDLVHALRAVSKLIIDRGYSLQECVDIALIDDFVAECQTWKLREHTVCDRFTCWV